MTTIFHKLNLKTETEIVIINAPASFEPELAALDDVRILRSVAPRTTVRFAVAFVTAQAELDAIATSLMEKAEGDATLWFAYPKRSSKKYRCDFDRDSGWHALGDAGYEGVRMVAIDDDWSALRFRRVEYIKSLTRDSSRAASKAGKARTTKI